MEYTPVDHKVILWDWKAEIPLDEIMKAAKRLNTWDVHMIPDTQGDDWGCVVGVKSKDEAQEVFWSWDEDALNAEEGVT